MDSSTDAGDTGSIDGGDSALPDGGDGDVDADADADTDTDTGPVVNPNALYVSLDGDDTNDGRSLENPLRTILGAAQRAVEGETIYVAPGDYGRELVEFSNQGSEDAPIVLEGYRDEPGDRPTLPDFDHESSLAPSIMPLLDGGDRGSGTAISLSGREYVVVRNIQITNYENGVYAWGADHVTVEDMVLTTFGVNDDDVYSGKGIIFGSSASFCTVRNSVVVNAGAEGIMLYGDDNRVQDCRVYGSDGGGTNQNSPDYYMMIQGDRNTIEDSLVQRVGDLFHGGHGIGIKGWGTDNIIGNNVADGFRGSPFYARHRGVVGNTFSDNTARNGGLGMTFRDGASENVVERFNAEGVSGGIVFFDTSEDEELQFAGNDNIVRDSTFIDITSAVIWLHDYIYNDTYSRRNIIENITVDGAPLLFDVRSFGEDNVLQDSTINNVEQYIAADAPRTEDDLGFTVTGCDGTGNGFDFP